MANKVHLPDDRYFGPDPRQKEVAQRLYAAGCEPAAHLPARPRGPAHVRAIRTTRFGSPADLLIVPGPLRVSDAVLPGRTRWRRWGFARKDGGQDREGPPQDLADVRQPFPSVPGDPNRDVAGPRTALRLRRGGEAVQRDRPRGSTIRSPRSWRRRSSGRVRCSSASTSSSMSTTDCATDPAAAPPDASEVSDWKGRVVPCFRPDAVVNLDAANWRKNIQALSAVSKIEVKSYKTYIAALWRIGGPSSSGWGPRRPDHAAVTAYTGEPSPRRGRGDLPAGAEPAKATAEDATRFTGHMLMEMARMSIEDGLVMQLHVGSFRNHNPLLYERFGTDMGADIPTASEFTRNLRPLLSQVRQRDASDVDPVQS
ncbi:MAG: glucuronate isomerase [Desulfobacterales bacterium]|nr:glucuronate isomerase [Desulfobacterales bacterium]